MALAENVLIDAGLAAGLFDLETLARARAAARQRHIPLLDALAFDRRFPVSALYHAAAQARGLPFFHGGNVTVDEDLLQRLPAGLMQRHRILPVRAGEGGYLLTDSPDDTAGLAMLRNAVGGDAQAAVCDPDLMQSLFRRHLPARAGTGTGHTAGEHDAVTLSDRLLTEAWRRRASDIHIEPLERGLRLRMRVDGRLQELGQRFTLEQGAAIVSRIKVLANMDIAETRAAQDGGFAYKLAHWDVPPMDLRAAAMPTLYGERLTLRVLGDAGNRISLDELGMPPSMLTRLREALARPYGLLLVTGPTGSGKSTTLYAALREVNADLLNVLTAEDPVEQQVAGISQSPVTPKLSFADAVRAFLRHDPDIILVGEVRDGETADAAIKASMTGHMVLSTLHTNRAVAAVTRLADIGCERYLIAANLAGVIAQRLARRLCRHCRRERPSTAAESALFGEDPPVALYEPGGCAACLGIGYAGRIGLYEALWVDDDLADAIQTGASERELAVRARDLHSLREDVLAKLRAGITSLDEVRYLL